MMVHVIDATDTSTPVETTQEVTPPVETKSKAQSILERIAAKSAGARENMWTDMPLPDTVPGNLGLRLGVPVETFASVWEDAPSLERSLADLGENVIGIVAMDERNDTPADVIEGLSLMQLAVVFAEQLYGADRSGAINSSSDAVRELFSRGSPPRVNAQAVHSCARAYRGWSLDPTRRSSKDRDGSE